MRPIAVRRLYPRLRFERRAAIRALRVLDAHHRTLSTPQSLLGGAGELSIAFLADAALARLHGQFLGDPSPTDVITFPGDAALGTAGEICVSVDAARCFATEHGRDFSEELTLYIVHGWLHLAGHDDLRPSCKRVMRRAEARAMAALRAAGALPKFVLA